eukprot:scaffold8194_cov248-Pinguiococcus_pyrenoidosus.AAC.10
MYRRYEAFFGQRADHHLCVSNVMADWLVEHFGLRRRPTVLYDRPPAHFKRTDVTEAHELFMRLRDIAAPVLAKVDGFPSYAEGQTPLTRTTPVKSSASLGWRPDRPLFLISSTSWTPDEDFSMLLTALEDLDAFLEQPGGQVPFLLCMITGKGPERERYEAKIEGLRLRRCAVVTAFLEPQDYPLLLGCADLGVCLHTSSSGLDLPMKVLDMYGAQVPVCAAGFPALGELVKEHVTGEIFSSHSAAPRSEGLTSKLEQLISGGIRKKDGALAKMRDNITRSETFLTRWEQNWSDILAEEVRCSLREGDGPGVLLTIATIACMALVALVVFCLRTTTIAARWHCRASDSGQTFPPQLWKSSPQVGKRRGSRNPPQRPGLGLRFRKLPIRRLKVLGPLRS